MLQSPETQLLRTRRPTLHPGIAPPSEEGTTILVDVAAVGAVVAVVAVVDIKIPTAPTTTRTTTTQALATRATATGTTAARATTNRNNKEDSTMLSTSRRTMISKFK